jgi:hypothetical protein
LPLLNFGNTLANILDIIGHKKMKKVSATEYDKIMGKKISEIKDLPIEEQFIKLIEESAKYEIKEKKSKMLP